MIKFVFDYDKSKRMGIVQSEYLDNLREHFSVIDKTANIKKLRYDKFIPTRHYAITKLGKFKVGMFGEIANYLRYLNIPYKMVITEPLKNIFFSPYNIENISKLKYELRDYQELAVKKCLKQGNGVVEIGTGGGKTLIMASIVQTVREHLGKEHTTLIIVPGIQLVEQTYNDFLSYGIDKNIISKWSGHNPYQNTPIIIASSSILQSKNTMEDNYKNVDLLLFDECHKLRRGNKCNKIVSKIKTQHKFSFTGTMPEDKIDQWNIIGLFGPILIRKSSKALRDEDFITDAIVQVIRIKYKNPLIYKTQSTFLDPTSRYNEELEFIHNHPYRNDVICKLANNTDRNILILVDRIEHGETLKTLIEKRVENKSVYFIQGNVEVNDREAIRKMMEEEDNIICIAMTSIFSTGINIKNLHYILFASAGKAKIKIIQSIGRGLRLHENKDTLIIFDISDQLEYSTKHLGKRLSLYNKEKIKHVTKEIKEN